MEALISHLYVSTTIERIRLSVKVRYVFEREHKIALRLPKTLKSFSHSH